MLLLSLYVKVKELMVFKVNGSESKVRGLGVV